MKSKELNAAINKQYWEDVVFGSEMMADIARLHSEYLRALTLDFAPESVYFYKYLL